MSSVDRIIQFQLEEDEGMTVLTEGGRLYFWQFSKMAWSEIHKYPDGSDPNQPEKSSSRTYRKMPKPGEDPK